MIMIVVKKDDDNNKKDLLRDSLICFFAFFSFTTLDAYWISLLASISHVRVSYVNTVSNRNTLWKSSI